MSRSRRPGGRGENLSVARRYGKEAWILFLPCRSCSDLFSNRKGTQLFRLHLTEEKAAAVFEHLKQGCGVPHTERLVGIQRDTLTR